jgi:hypothetical protein
MVNLSRVIQVRDCINQLNAMTITAFQKRQSVKRDDNHDFSNVINILIIVIVPFRKRPITFKLV